MAAPASPRRSPAWVALLPALALIMAPGSSVVEAAASPETPPEAAALDTSRASPDGDWVVLEVTGQATWRRQGEQRWQAIEAGRVLSAPSEIETGETGGVTLVLGGDRLVVASSSRLILIARGVGGTQQLRQERGRLRVDIEQRPGRAVEVRTPLLSLGIKGTSFEVTVDPWQNSVLVLEGRVTVTTGDGGAPVDLGPREGLSQPAGPDRAAERLTFPDLPPAGGRSGLVRWHLAAPAASPPVGAGVATTTGGEAGQAVVRERPTRRSASPREPSWLSVLLDDQTSLVTLVLLAAAALAILIMPGVVLGQNLRQQWLDRSGGKGKRRRSLIRGW